MRLILKKEYLRVVGVKPVMMTHNRKNKQSAEKICTRKLVVLTDREALLNAMHKWSVSRRNWELSANDASKNYYIL